ncbi:MAG: NUDIX domain-containing protein [Clostridium butyricum]|nr:NUDIX domain-containing protein [Clostridium butyricum]
MGWINDIKNYIPYNEQEETDKKLILQCLNTYDDLLSRENSLAHITSSGYIINKNKDKTLMIHHNIYKTWSWTGGHADNDCDLLSVAIKEAKEETGIKNFKALSDNIFSLDVLPVIGHFKNGKYVSAHLHLSVAYLLEADENEKLFIKEDENSGVMWIPLNEIHKYSNEPDMVELYYKFNKKLKIL